METTTTTKLDQALRSGPLGQKVRTYRDAKEKAETTRAHWDDHARRTLENGDYRVGHEFRTTTLGERILDPSLAYLMEDTQFAEYESKLQELRDAEGCGLDPGYCPALVAESELRDRERELLEELETVLDAPRSSFVLAHPDKRERLLDSLLVAEALL